MKKPVSASLTVGFGADAGRGRLSFETDETKGAGSLRYAYAKLYPMMIADTYVVQAVGGTMTNLGTRTETITETIEFAGSQEAELKHIPLARPTFGERTRWFPVDLIFSLDEIGDPWPALQCDMERGVVMVDRPIWGWVKVEYHAQYISIQFDRGQRIELSPYAQVSGGGGIRSNPLVQRVIAVSEDYGSAVWEVPDEPQREAEVYRVTSQYLVDADGTHEMPDGWPGTLVYPDDTPAPDPEETAVVERVHEIGRLDANGRFSIGSTTLSSPGRWFPPYESAEDYTPKFTLVKLDASGDVEAHAENVDWDSLQQVLDARFPGLTLEG